MFIAHGLFRKQKEPVTYVVHVFGKIQTFLSVFDFRRTICKDDFFWCYTEIIFVNMSKNRLIMGYDEYFVCFYVSGFEKRQID